jgi:hypothetical protein
MTWRLPSITCAIFSLPSVPIFFQQSGFIDCGDLAYHDNAGFWQIRDVFF